MKKANQRKPDAEAKADDWSDADRFAFGSR